jgi:murein DD-endopeptidase MepM/ murein hydrolase activator NlpD
MQRRIFLVSLGSFALVGCGDRDEPPARPTESPTRPQRTQPPPASTATATVGAPTPTAGAPTATPTERPFFAQPFGFPVDLSARTGRVTGDVGSRVLRWGHGPTVLDYASDDQPSDDPVRANACGWNARTHFEYEGQPAVDWYLPEGTPVWATMDGLATLLVNTVSNPFDVYGVSREPYIGNPDRPRAPISPFPGPGGGQGVFVRVENRQYRTDYGHLDIGRTLDLVPEGTFLSAYNSEFDYRGEFSPLRDFRLATAIAAWDVRRGDVIGYTGDSGYSEAPHLHYTVRRAGNPALLCPTNEPGFAEGGWLFR